MTQRVKSTIPPPPSFVTDAPLDRVAEVNRGDWTISQGGFSNDNLKTTMGDKSVNNPKHSEEEETKNAVEAQSRRSSEEHCSAVPRPAVFDSWSQEIATSKGKADGSSETHQSKKQSIADLIQAIKTDPEIKRLLNDALSENKSFATKATPVSPATVPLDFAQQVLTTETRAAEGFPSCETGPSDFAACALDKCPTCKITNVPTRQVEHGGKWQDVAESVATSSKTWTPYRPATPVFDGWTSCPTKLVVVKDVKYTIHDTIFDTMFPANNTSTKLDQLDDDSFLVSGIQSRYFASALEFLYSQDTKHLCSIPVEGQNQILSFAAKYDNNYLLCVMIPILELDFSNPGFSSRAATIYRSYAAPEDFRQYFRQTLKVELQTRLDDGSCEEFLSGIHSQFSDAGVALLDVALVLNSLWTNAELKVEHADPAEDWSDKGVAQEDDGKDAYDDRTSNTCGGNMIGPDYTNQWGDYPPKPSQCSRVWHAPVQCDSEPQPPCAAIKSNLQTAKVPAPSIITPPSHVVLEALQPRDPSPSWEEPLAQPLRADTSHRAIDNTNDDWIATALQGTSALARCVYHHLRHRDVGKVATVAEYLGCTKDEADRALQELMLVGVVDNRVSVFGDVTVFVVKKELPQEPITTALPANDVVETEDYDKARAWPLSLGTRSEKTRMVYLWLKYEQAFSTEETWFSAQDVSDALGFDIPEALLSLNELESTGHAEIAGGPWDSDVFRLYSSEQGH
ncbi:hypothetical protein A1O7_04923 [Cladophialophora yegresii CBS 114405]|uniref:Uncharacterized protein n=1 Tax=Cladophialophora yegresii CBS 114405 TaxID=1182544 RepID=W9W6Z1_9EURO|nr:uncharacterized protein A1O7_04923 [Cladophialophora yegresii CBS 114405]EXJ60770.1 hypothetical protein A1O7_04923 [Cladophialophora yegresii CBS 114405]